MGEAWFYHMTRTPLEATLPVLLEKSLDAGWRVAVRTPDPSRLDWLDRVLWGPGESFLPHGVAGGPHDPQQPVLLGTQPEAANDPQCVVSVDGAPIAVEELSGLARAMVLFDGNSPQAVEEARDLWRRLTSEGAKAKYWSQESGQWEMKAEKQGK